MAGVANAMTSPRSAIGYIPNHSQMSSNINSNNTNNNGLPLWDYRHRQHQHHDYDQHQHHYNLQHENIPPSFINGGRLETAPVISSTPPPPPPSSLKRRSVSSPTSTSSPLDCHSLQSSLKRVRLSCSPGELRLQRDLRCLSDWDQIAQDRWIRHTDVAEMELFVQDPLRLLLQVSPKISTASSSTTDKINVNNNYRRHQQQQQNTAVTTTPVSPVCLWLQFPRMYPHRPPSIPRIAGGDADFWIERIIVQDAPPESSVNTNTDSHDFNDIITTNLMSLNHCQNQHENYPSGHSSSTPSSSSSSSSSGGVYGNTIIYSRWSPIVHLSDLIDFLVQTIHQVATKQLLPSHATATTQQEGSTRLFGEKSSSSTSSSSSSPSSPIFPSSSKYNQQHHFLLQQHQNHHQYDDMLLLPNQNFVEEHKMEDTTFNRQRRRQQQQQQQQQQQRNHYFGSTSAFSATSFSSSSSSVNDYNMCHENQDQNQRYHNDNTSNSSNNKYVASNCCFAPNRFDMGYGKYVDPSLRQHQHHHNSMDVN